MENIAVVIIFIMAGLCANMVVGGAARVGRAATTCVGQNINRSCNSRIIGVGASSYCRNYLSQRHHAGHTTGRNICSMSNGLAFVTSPSISEYRISNPSNQLRPHQLQPPIPQIISHRRRSSTQVNDADTGEFYANPESFPDFDSLGITSDALLKRLTSSPLRLGRPSAVQAAVFDTILNGENDVIVGAETGSGKTLAYLMPLVEDILKRKREWKESMVEGSDGIIDPGYDYARALILVPNKELAHQALRMAASICGGLDRCVVWGADALGLDFNQPSLGDVPEEEVVRLALFPGGLSSPQDFPPFRYATTTSPNHPRQPPPDLVFATPANLGPLALSPKHIDLFADISTVVVDEADMLLDGGYIRQLNNVLMGFRRADKLLGKYDSISFSRKSDEIEDETELPGDGEEEEEEKIEQKKTQHVFVAATLPDYGLRSVDAYLNRKFPNATAITMEGMHNARHYGLEGETKTIWDEVEENKDRMKRLVDVLKLDRREVGEDGRGLKGEKVMVFLNTVRDVDGAANGLRRAGINAVPYHAKISLADRTANLDKFRRYRAPTDDNVYDGAMDDDKNTVPVLVCTDVASRGLDIPGVTAIVQLQFATNVVSHLHRMGRCGRAGNRDGRGIIFYGPRERELVEVVREAEDQQSRMTLTQDVEDDLDNSGTVDGATKREGGKVQKAFSRRRGFTKKRKKQRRNAMEAMEYD